FQVHRQAVARLRPGPPEQLIHLLLGQAHGQDAVLETVVIENVREGRRDDDPETVVQKRPRRVFPGRSAAEVAAGQQDAGTLVAGLVEDEIRVGRAVLKKPPVKKEELPESRALDALQELLRNDLEI